MYLKVNRKTEVGWLLINNKKRKPVTRHKDNTDNETNSTEISAITSRQIHKIKHDNEQQAIIMPPPLIGGGH